MTDYQEFRAQWEQMHLASLPTPPQGEKASRWMRVGIGAMFICAAMLSGVHTVPTVRAGIEVTDLITADIANTVALASFVAVEIAMLLAGYGVSKSRLINWLVTGAALILAVAANISSVSRALAGGDDLTKAVALIMGVFAPSMAFLAGSALVGLRDDKRQENAEAWREYRVLLNAHEKRVNAAWEKEQASARPSAPPDNAAERPLVRPQADIPDGQQHGYGQGYTRRTDAQERVRAHLTDSPEDASLTVRELADKLKVGKTTVADVMQELRAQRMNGNGHRQEQSG